MEFAYTSQDVSQQYGLTYIKQQMEATWFT